MAVAHVIDTEDDAVLELGYDISNSLEKLILLLAGLFVDLGHMNDLCALRFRHDGRSRSFE